MKETKQPSGHDRSLTQRLPLELWQMILCRIPTLSAQDFADEFGTHLCPSQEKHNQLWRRIFKDEKWLLEAEKFHSNPTLVGRDLSKLYHQSGKAGYLILLASHSENADLCYRNTQFFESIKEGHYFDEKTSEVTFQDGLILNIYDLFLRDDPIVVIDLKNLFSYRHKKLRSTYLFWQDPAFSPRWSTSKNIHLGLAKTPMSKPNDLYENFCCLNLSHSDGTSWEHYFDDNEICIRKGERYIRFPRIGEGKLQPHPRNEFGRYHSTAEARKIIQRSAQ